MASTQKVLQKHASQPKYDSAQILTNTTSPTTTILLHSTVRDTNTGARRKLRTLLSFPSSSVPTDLAAIAQFTYEEHDSVIASAANPHVEHERVVLRAIDDKAKGGSAQRFFVERWGAGNLKSSIEVTSAHGEFYPPDGTFGYISFDAKRPSRVAYVAERKSVPDEGPGKFAFEDTWGEQFGERKWAVGVVVDFEGGLGSGEAEKGDSEKGDGEKGKGDGEVKKRTEHWIVLEPEEGTACGQPIFSPTDGKLIWVALPTRPLRFGAKFCFNRPSYLVESAYDGSGLRKLTMGDRHVRSPLLGPKQEVYYLNNPTGGGHDQCTALSAIDLQSLATRTVVPIIQAPTGEFTGLFTLGITAIDGDQLYLTSQQRSTKRALAFNLNEESPKPRQIPAGVNGDDSWDLLCCSKGQVVVARHGLYGEVSVEYHRSGQATSSEILVHDAIEGLTDAMSGGVVTYPDRPHMESILLMPSNKNGEFYKGHEKPPAVIYVHGGPHGAFATAHDPLSAAMAECGIAMLLVNYTGSTGFGQDGINKLVGHIGDVDVDDVKFARDHLIGTGVVDKDRVAVMGGSHGGFLTAWMLGKFPDVFRCGVLRNPVINVGTMIGSTDIPDWCSEEVGEAVNYASPSAVTPEQYSKMWHASPISVAKNVKAPVMLSLGGKDRRVPNSQGQYYLRYLRGQGLKDIKTFMYPEDNHGLDSTDGFRLGLRAIIDFFHEHL